MKFFDMERSLLSAVRDHVQNISKATGLKSLITIISVINRKTGSEMRRRRPLNKKMEITKTSQS